MKNQKVAALLAAFLIAIVGAGLLWAQKRAYAQHGIELWPTDDGARLGVRLEDVTSEKVGELKLPGEYGAIVTQVDEDSPAAKAGLEKNDVILEFAGEKVWSAAQLRRMIQETPPGRVVALKVSRSGQTRTLNVTLQAGHHHAFGDGTLHMPEIVIPDVKIPHEWFDIMGGTRLGISADNLTPQLAEYFGVKERKGVLVREVKADSPAQKAGLKAGDCIVRVDDTAVATVDDLHRALSKSAKGAAPEKREVKLTIVRERHEQTVKAELEFWGLHRERYTADNDELEQELGHQHLAPPEEPLMFFGEDADL